LLRADGFLYCAVAGLFLIARRVRPGHLVGLIGGFLIIGIPYFSWRYDYYGFVFPNSYYLKTGGGIFQQLRGLFYVYNFIEPFGGPLLCSLPMVLILLRDPLRNAGRLYFGLMLTVMTIYIAWVGGDHMPMARFFVPLIVPLTLLMVESAIELRTLFDQYRHGMGRWVELMVATCIGVAAVAPTLNFRRLPASYVISHRVLVEQWGMAGRWLKMNVATTSLMATEPAGAVAFESGLRIVDMLGVNDRHIAHLKVAGMGRGSAGHEKRDMAYVLQRKPDLFFRGVHHGICADDSLNMYPDGSKYRLRCASLGLGPVADAFGTVREVPLYVWFEERVPP
jgi:arabinofuranosyltransferase